MKIIKNDRTIVIIWEINKCKIIYLTNKIHPF
jgi:hypothetical protein